MKNLTKGLILAVFLGSMAFVSPALAYYPNLTATSQGSGSILVSVNSANPYSQINLSSRQTSTLWTVVNNIGQTDGSGSFSQVISLPSDGSSNPIQLYVTVGGTQSSTVSVYPNGGGCYGSYCGGCTYNCGSGTLSLNQTSVNLTVGQTTIVTPTTNYYGSLYVSSNSNSAIATAVSSGSGVSIYGQSAGSDTITLCSNNNSCATVYVYVTGSTCYSSYCGSTGSLTFSQNNPTLSVGQTSNITIYSSNNYYSGSNFYISSNSNSSVVSSSISGQSLNLYGNSNGSSTIIVCQNSGSTACGTLYVTVSGSTCNSGYCGYGSLTFSQSSVNINVGQNTNITANNNYGTLYLSNNSNSSVASVTFSGNLISVYGNAIGTTNLTICSSASVCGIIYVTVGINGTGTITLSPSVLNLTSPQTSSVIISGSSYNGTYYVSSNSNPSVATASVSGNTLYVNSLFAGSTTITVCQSSSASQCGTLYVTVNGGGTGCYSNCSGTLSLSQSSVNLNIGQSTSVVVYGANSGSLYVSSNSNSSVVTPSISGNTITFYGQAVGSSTVSICSNSYSCATIYAVVGNGYGGGYGSLSLSQTSLSLSTGQTASINVYGSGSYYISSNSNSYVATPTVSGSYVSIYGSQIGTTNISVCQNSGSTACATIYVTVSGNGAYNNGLYLSPSSLSISVGQTGTVNASGNGGYGYYLGANSNPGIISPSISGSSISVYGLQNGSANLQVCQNSSGCVTLYVSVGNGNGGGLQYPGGNVLGASTYPNGELIGENGTVSIVYKNTKTGFASASVFTGLGFSFNNVIQVGNSGLNTSGYTVGTAYASHPWGSWIKSGSTVYFVHESGLIPVPNWSTFLNNNGSASFIVPANAYDFRLPILSPMVNGDSRLQ